MKAEPTVPSNCYSKMFRFNLPTQCRLVTLVAAALATFLSACATPVPEQNVQPGERPDATSDEASFWMITDRAEKDAKTSGQRVTDPALNKYVKGVICKIAEAHCQDIRVYIVRRPLFNASMMPNGAMFVWTGLLLRAHNESQLAFVLGHELAHYLRRHTLARMREVRAKTDATAFAGIALSLAGVGYVRPLVQLAVLGSLMSYSRDQERDADSIGLEMMADAAYDPREGAKIWDGLVAEKEAGEWPADPFCHSSPGFSITA